MDFHVIIIPQVDGDGFEAKTTVWSDEEAGENVDLVNTHEDAFFAFLNIKLALDAMKVEGSVYPEFRPEHLPTGKGFYGMPSKNEAMPLKAGR